MDIAALPKLKIGDAVIVDPGLDYSWDFWSPDKIHTFKNKVGIVIEIYNHELSMYCVALSDKRDVYFNISRKALVKYSIQDLDALKILNL